MPSRELSWLPLYLVEAVAQAARDRGVSERALSPGQFFAQYRRAHGNPAQMPPAWRDKRNGFVARHREQMLTSDRWGSGWDANGDPTPRHLALAVWAWSPAPARLARWLAYEGYLE